MGRTELEEYIETTPYAANEDLVDAIVEYVEEWLRERNSALADKWWFSHKEDV